MKILDILAKKYLEQKGLPDLKVTEQEYDEYARLMNNPFPRYKNKDLVIYER